jgi:hypothetical protein
MTRLLPSPVIGSIWCFYLASVSLELFSAASSLASAPPRQLLPFTVLTSDFYSFPEPLCLPNLYAPISPIIFTTNERSGITIHCAVHLRWFFKITFFILVALHSYCLMGTFAVHYQTVVFVQLLLCSSLSFRSFYLNITPRPGILSMVTSISRYLVMLFSHLKFTMLEIWIPIIQFIF